MPHHLDTSAADFEPRFRALLASKREDAADVGAAVEAIIADVRARGDAALIERLMTEGDYHGMATFDQALFRLFSEDVVSLDEALSRAAHPEDFRIAVQQAGLATLH